MLEKITKLIKSANAFGGLGITLIVIITAAGLLFLVKSFQNNLIIENEQVLASVFDSALGENLTDAAINETPREIYILPVEETVAPKVFNVPATDPEATIVQPQQPVSPNSTLAVSPSSNPTVIINPSTTSISPAMPIFVPSNTSPELPIAGGGGAPPAPAMSPSPEVFD